MKKRKLLNNVYSFLPRMYQGSEVRELDAPIDLIIHTKAPGKWLLIDLETGQEYIGLDQPDQYGVWKRIKEKD
jgi:hypothetical protein